MRLLAPISALLLMAGVSTGLLAFQRGGYGGDEYGGAREAFSSSDNENGKNEYSWSRLRYYHKVYRLWRNTEKARDSADQRNQSAEFEAYGIIVSPVVKPPHD